MDYQRELGLALMLAGLCVEGIAILLSRNIAFGLVGVAVSLIGWRIRWAA